MSDRLATTCSRIILPDISKYTRQYFDLRCNPFHREGETASNAWFDNFGILSGTEREKFFNSRFCLLVSLCYPDADLEHLRPAMDSLLWLFSFDDMADLGEFKLEGLERAVNITMNVLHDPDSAQPNLNIAATLHRMRRNGNPTAIRHFVEATESYTRAITQEMIDKLADHVQTFEEYRKYRPDTSAVKLTLATLEYAHRINIPDEVLYNPVITELSLAGNEILTWANDVYSFPLELQDAVDYVNQLIEQRVQDYLEAKARLPSFGPDLDNEVARYIQGIEYSIQACIDWSFITTRKYCTGTSIQNANNTQRLLWMRRGKRQRKYDRGSCF
ncbi:isoprenoid synthase domain-containing protein [Rhizoctonia solani]|nr:isoprenoid synthase domain-containing protein [Rhizoctonia solani]